MFRLFSKRFVGSKFAQFSKFKNISVPLKLSIAAGGACLFMPNSHNDGLLLPVVAPPLPALEIKSELKAKSEKTILQRIEYAFYALLQYLRSFMRVTTYAAYASPVAILFPASYYLKDSYPQLETYLWDYILWSIGKIRYSYCNVIYLLLIIYILLYRAIRTYIY